MASTPLIMGIAQQEALARLRAAATRDPIDMKAAAQTIKTPVGRKAHIDRMSRLSVVIPYGFFVTFSIETGHGSGTMRHMSISTKRRRATPTPEAVWLVAKELGFIGDQMFEGCHVWDELLDHDQGSGKGDETAINVIQPIALSQHIAEADTE